MADPVSPEERAAALEWLEQAISFREEEEGIQYSVVEDERHRATIRRLLALPTLPEEPTMEMLSVMREAYTRTSLTAIGTGPAAAYYALRAELLKPATREVKVWHVLSAHCGRPKLSLADNEVQANNTASYLRADGHVLVRVTGPHLQEIPT